MTTKQQITLFAEGIANDLTAQLKKNVPVDTGFLKNSIEVKKDGEGFKINMADYALHLEFGTAPHIIRPVSAKALKFKNRGGEDVFATIVHHPGTTAQPFIRTTFYNHLFRIIKSNAERFLK